MSLHIVTPLHQILDSVLPQSPSIYTSNLSYHCHQFALAYCSKSIIDHLNLDSYGWWYLDTNHICRTSKTRSWPRNFESWSYYGGLRSDSPWVSKVEPIAPDLSVKFWISCLHCWEVDAKLTLGEKRIYFEVRRSHSESETCVKHRRTNTESPFCHLALT